MWCILWCGVKSVLLWKTSINVASLLLQGRNPFFLEPAIIVAITDGSKLTSSSGVQDEVGCGSSWASLESFFLEKLSSCLVISFLFWLVFLPNFSDIMYYSSLEYLISILMTLRSIDLQGIMSCRTYHCLLQDLVFVALCTYVLRCAVHLFILSLLQLHLPLTTPLPGSELTKEPFRWDQRLFSLVLRIPGHASPDPEPMGGVPLDSSPITPMCEVTGGMCVHSFYVLVLMAFTAAINVLKFCLECSPTNQMFLSCGWIGSLIQNINMH